MTVEVVFKKNFVKPWLNIYGSFKLLSTSSNSFVYNPRNLSAGSTPKGTLLHPDKLESEKNLCLKFASYTADKKSVDGIFELVEQIFDSQDENVSSSLEAKIKLLCNDYSSLSIDDKFNFLRKLGCDYDVDHGTVLKYINHVKSANLDQNEFCFIGSKLRSLITPKYLFLFKRVARFPNGVKFLVDLRADILLLQSKLTAVSPESTQVKQLNSILRNLISDWFSVGFLELHRITWKSSCAMLQKISEYEAVHPMRSWTDLKRRVGPYRRCFVYTHFAMPDEPLIVLHTALCKEIASSMEEIFSISRNSEDAGEGDLDCINTAIFYSISSTQPGLQGIELGNHLIKRVVRELQSELPQIKQFSTLSPIPGFSQWLLDRIKLAEAGDTINWFPVEEIRPFVRQDSSFWKNLRQLFVTNAWYKEPALHSVLEKPLLKLCAHYLFNEKKRGYALNSVANFHLRNGAVMWRINWLADTSPRGLSNSCGLMVNYRYFLDETEANSDGYLKSQIIVASESIKKLAGDKMLTSKL